MSDSEPVVITGAGNIEAARLLAIRGALRLEARGMKKRGPSARSLANEVMGTSYRSARVTYTEYDQWLVRNLPGTVSRPWPQENL
jgi:hypothetical protein